MSNDKPRRSPLRLVVGLLLVVLLAAGAFTFVLWRSAAEIGEHADAADRSFQTSMEQVEAQDYRGALVSVRTTASDLALIQEKLQGWQWQAAARVPLLTDDVACARDCADVANTLVNDALLPVLDKAEVLVGLTETATSPQLIGDTLSQLPELYQTAKDARAVVAECKTRADALPTSHFDQVNEMATEVRDAATQADEAFASLDPLFQAIDALGDLASMLGSLGAQTLTPAT